MQLLTAGSWKRRSTSLFVAFTIFAAVLPIVAAQHALANGLSLQVKTWLVDTDSGVATYDLTVSASGANAPGAPCSAPTGRCKYRVDAIYRDATGDTTQKTLASNYASGTFSVPITGSAVVGETTHLKATLYDVYGTQGIEKWEQWVGVSAPYPDGSISLEVSKWDVDTDWGAVDYDVTMRIKGAGQMNGPCQNVRCYYGVYAYYKDGSTEKLQHTLHNYDCLSGCWSVTKQITATAAIRKEVTHLRARVYPSASSCPAPCSKESWESWVAVGAPYPNGSISLDVTKWSKDSATGSVDYDITMGIVGAGQENGPCQVRCYARVQAWAVDGSSQTLKSTIYSYDCISGCWAVSKQVTATSAMTGVTHLQAIVYPASSACPAPCSREVYDTGLIPVSDFMIDDIDVTALALTLAEQEVIQLDLCITVEERARVLRIPDATPATSPHSATEACLGASSVRTALIAVGAVVGGAAVVGSIIDHYAGDDPNADSIAKIPAPETDVAGSGVRPPASCLSDEQKTSILEELRNKNSYQNHHVATNKSPFWKSLFEGFLARPENDYATGQTLKGDWNIIEDMEQAGNHPPAYHAWVSRNMEKALRESTTWEEFEAKYTEWVVDVVDSDRTIVRWEWWRCP